MILNKRYMIGRVLGHGGFGITYLAWDLNLNLKLAVKEYLPRDYGTRAPGHSSVTIFSSETEEFFAERIDNTLA